jgi:hypothetical protein
MSDSHDLHQQIHNITELNNVLGNLLSERSLCDMEITAELFFRYIEAVKYHLQNTESAVFARLLVNADDEQSRLIRKNGVVTTSCISRTTTCFTRIR